MSFWKELFSGFTGKKPEQEPAPVSPTTSAYSKDAAWSAGQTPPGPPAADISQMAIAAVETVRLRATARGIDPRSIEVALQDYQTHFPKVVAELQAKARADGLTADLERIVETLNDTYLDVISEHAVTPEATATPPVVKDQADAAGVKPRRTSVRRKSEVLKRFVAIDVETANRQRHSICQIGVVLFEDGKEVAAEKVLVDPREDFGDVQMRIHGIQPQHVAGHPCFAEHHAWLTGWIAGHHVVSHTDFDLQAITQACAAHSVPAISYSWHDSCEAARKAWPDLPNHKLGTLADACGIIYEAHDALADARVAGQLFFHAKSGTSIEGVRQVLGTEPVEAVRGGPLSGHCVTFTNEFDRPEADLRRMAVAGGATIADRIGKKTTTILVVGAHGRRAEWGDKSRAQKDAERWVEEGKGIRIVAEDEFIKLTRAGAH